MTAEFSFKRLGYLIRRQWVENARLYLYSALALIGLLGIVFAIWLNADAPNYNEESIVIMFIIGLFISGAAFASMSFKALESKEKGSYWLALPASHLEKLVCTIFFNLVVFTLVYCVCFLVIEELALSYVHGLLQDPTKNYYLKKIDWQDEEGIVRVLRDFLCGFFAVQALFILGSVYFKRFAFILTTIFLAAFVFSLAYYMSKISKIMPSYFTITDGAVFQHIEHTDKYKKFLLGPFVKDILVFLIAFMWAPVFWVVTWFRLKEKEI